jgi:Tol biopolymer transport system component
MSTAFPVLRVILVAGFGAAMQCGVAAAEPPPYARTEVTRTPVVFGGGAVRGSSPSFTPDGATVFTHEYSKTQRRHTILVSHFAAGRWSASQVAPFSGIEDDLEPSVSADGTRVVFASARHAEGRPIGLQLWSVERTPAGWSEPRLLDAPVVRLPNDSGAPSQARDGSLAFGRIVPAPAGGRRGWPWEVYFAPRTAVGYAEPVRINDAINPGGRAWAQALAPDASYLILAAVIDADTPRPDSLGDIDLYVSFRDGTGWTRAQNLGPAVNTPAAEVWPRLSPDGQYLFFNRQGPDGGRIFQIDVGPLLAPLRPATGGDLAAEARPFAPGVISTPDHGGITFSPDGRTAYFGGKTPKGGWGILVSRLRDGEWTAPEVAPFSGGDAAEGDPQMSPDGRRLYFFSQRAAEGKPLHGWWPDLWYVEWQGEGWGAPQTVGAGPDGAWNPLTLRAGTASPAADGTLYFFRCLDPQGKRVRIVRSRPIDGRYLDFEDLGDVVNGRDDGGFDVGVAPDQSFIVFTCSKRADSLGRNDLYISYRDGAGWTESHNLGPRVNTPADEYSPTISRDGRTLYFSRSGIWSIPLAACDGVRPGVGGTP